MADTPTAVRLFRRMRVRQASAQPDFGDHGTAFGLDLSMSPQEPEADPPRRAPARGVGFWRRLANRRYGTTD